jgi:hypothetical protein
MKHTKESILEILNLLENDCRAMANELESGGYADPWDVNDFDNWDGMASTVNEAIEFIKKCKVR